MKYLVWGLLFCLPLVYADRVFVPVKEIEKRRIFYKQLQPIDLSYDGKSYAATELVSDPKKKLRGVSHVLHVFSFGPEGIDNVKSVDLPIAHLENATWNDKKNEICILANRGTKIILVNTDNMSLRTVFEHKRGKEGFRSGPFLFSHGGRFYATGWFYDRNQYWKSDHLVQYRFGKSKMKFTKKVDLKDLFENKFKPMHVRKYYYISGDKFFFNYIHPIERKTSLIAYDSGKTKELAKEFLISIFAATDKRIFYIVKEKDQSFSYYVQALDSGKKWKIEAPGDLRLTYPFLCNDTLVAVNLNLDTHTLTAFYGKENEDFRLKRFVKNESIGPMKVSGNGKVYFLMTHEGFHIGDLP